MIYSFLAKYHLSIEDYYDLAAIGLCKAAITYDGSSAFSTYAYRLMLNCCRMELRKQNQQKYIPDYAIVYYAAETKENTNWDTATFLNYLPAKENVEDDVITKHMADNYFNSLKNDRHKIIFKMFCDGYKQIEIARITGYSQPQISRVKKKFEDYITK